MKKLFPIRVRMLCRLVALAGVVAGGSACLAAYEPDAIPVRAEDLKTDPPAEPDKKPEIKAGKEEPEYRVKLKSGAVFEGELKAEAETTEERFVVLVVAGVETAFAKKDIESLTKLPTVDERYKEMRAALDPTDADQIVTLAEWLRARKRYDLAAKEIDEALKIVPQHKEALRLKLLIEQQSLLDQSSGTGKPLKERAKDSKAKFPTLKDDEINLMRVYEIDLKDPGRIIIGRELIEQLINRYGDNIAMPSSREGKDALYRTAPEKILDLMFRVQARDLYSKVKVVDAPRPLRLFREDVHRTWLLNSCATSACHGGEAAGRLRFCTDRTATDTTVLTNMFIIDRFRLRDGKSLINYESPADSPLLQYGLPPELSKNPHPDITASGRRKTDLKPTFRDLNDQRFQQGVEWIRSLYKPRPNYPFTLPLPGLDDGTKQPGRTAPSSTAPELSKAPTKPEDTTKTPAKQPVNPPAANPNTPDFPR